MLLVRVVLGVCGALAVAFTLLSAVRTVVLPRAAQVWMTTFVFITVRRVFSVRLRFARDYEARDRIMALYAPISLMLLPVVWLGAIGGAYTAIFWAAGVRGVDAAFVTSGSSLFTLGFVSLDTVQLQVIGFSEATVGLGALALLITYLPSLYGAFSRRENLVTRLVVRSDEPPTAAVLLWRYTAIHGWSSSTSCGRRGRRGSRRSRRATPLRPRSCSSARPVRTGRGSWPPAPCWTLRRSRPPASAASRR